MLSYPIPTTRLCTCVLTVSVPCTSTLLGYSAYLSPPGLITVRSASRSSFTNPTSLPLAPTRLLNAIKVFLSTFGCIVQSSKDSECVRRLSGLLGETCYVLLRDHFSSTLYDAALRSKAPPIECLTKWLASKCAGPTVDSKYVRMDLGGELGRCQEVLDLFTQAGYAVEPTAPNSSHQNEPVERPHRDIGNSIRAMLSGASLASRFWPYAFYHFLRLHNMTMHGD